MQRCRGAEVQRWRGAGAEVERWRGGEVERCRGAKLESGVRYEVSRKKVWSLGVESSDLENVQGRVLGNVEVG